jgi:hypothetical protein
MSSEIDSRYDIGKSNRHGFNERTQRQIYLYPKFTVTDSRAMQKTVITSVTKHLEKNFSQLLVRKKFMSNNQLCNVNRDKNNI